MTPKNWPEPVIRVVAAVLEALHLSAQALAASHVVGRAVAVLRIVAAADVVAEDVEVQALGQPASGRHECSARPQPAARRICGKNSRNDPEVRREITGTSRKFELALVPKNWSELNSSLT